MTNTHDEHQSAGTFGQWLATQAHRHDPVGDLARDYIEPCGCGDCGHGEARTIDELRDELADHGAIPQAYDALDRAATEWQAALPGGPRD